MRNRARRHRHGQIDRRILAAAGAFAAGVLVVFFLTRADSDAPVPETSQELNRTLSRTRSLRDGPQSTRSNEEAPERQVPLSAPVSGDIPSGTDSARFLGRVVDQDEVPVAGAGISFHCKHDSLSDQNSVSGNDGRYELRVADDLCGDAARAGRALSASAEGFASSAVRVVSMEPDDAGIFRHDFQLVRGGAITGRVVNENEEGVANARVGDAAIKALNQRDAEEVWRLITQTAEDGSFLLSGVPFDRQFVIPVEAEGYIPAFTKRVRAGDGEVEVVLRRGEASLYGRTQNHAGLPVESRILIRTIEPGSLDGFSTETLTDVHGAFDFPALPKGRLEVFATASESGATIRQELELALDERRELLLTYPPPAVVVGQALDITNQSGVSGLRIGPAGLDPAEAQFRDGTLVTSSVDGSYRFEIPVSQDGRAWIRAIPPEGWLRADGNARLTHRLDSLQPGEERQYDVLLRQGALVTGRVVGSDGEGVTSASVRARGNAAGSYASTTTSSGGSFRVTLARGATVEFYARSEAGEGTLDYVVPKRGTPDEAVITLKDFGSIHGTVTAKGDPVSEVTVSAVPTGVRGANGRGVSMETLADGTYLLESVSPGEAIVSVSVPEGMNFAPPEPEQVTVEPADTAGPVDFELSPGDVVEGVVLAQSGEPLPDATIVYKVPVASITATETRRTTSGDDGYFLIEGVPQGFSLTKLTVSRDGYHSEERFEVGAEDSPVSIVLSPKLDLPLVVYAQTPETPVASYQWRLYRIPERGVSYSGGARGWQETLIEEGRTTIPELEVGIYQVEVREMSSKGGPTGRTGAAEGRVHKTVAPEPVVIDIGSGLQLTGRVVSDDSGTGVTGARVDVLPPKTRTSGPPPESMALSAGLTGDDGTFVLADLTPADYAIAASKEGVVQFRDVTLKATEPHEPLEFLLAVTGNVSGVVTGPSGDRLSNYSIPWTSSVILADGSPGPTDSGTLEPSTGDRFRIEDLPVGRHLLKATEPESGRTAELTFPVYSGFDNSTLNVNFSERIRLSGTVTINGRLWTGQPPMLLTSRGNDYMEVSEPGRFETSVWPGEVSLLVRRNARSVRTGETFFLEAEPAEQERNFELTMTDADVVVIFPEEEPYVEGRITLIDIVDPVNNWKVTAMEEISTSPSMFARDLIPRNYEAEYRSLDGEWEGASDPVQIAPGLENIIIIEAQLVDSQFVVGSWTPQTVPQEWMALTYDVTEIVKGGGRYEAIVLHEFGTDGVEIDGGELIVDGAVDADAHSGWSGEEKRNHIYTFTASGAARSSAQLRLRLRGVGNHDTSGVIYLRREVR